MKKKLIDIEVLKEAAISYPTRKAAGEALGISKDTFSNLLKEHNIIFVPIKVDKPKCFKQYPEINEEWLIKNWVNTTKSIKELSQEVGCLDSLIESRIAAFKLKKPYKHSFNTDKFFNINDPHIWYLAGLAATDGHFPKHYDALQFSLVGEDEYQLLNSIKTYYESSKEIAQYHTDDKGDWHWIISYPGLQQFFVDTFNISMENKTYTTGIPKSFPSEDCAKAYVRGCIDGDGYITVTGDRVRVCTASETFTQGLGEIVSTYAGIPCNNFFVKGYTKKDMLYPAVEWKTNRAKRLLDWLYSLEDCFKLERKYLRYLNNKTV